MLDNVQGEAIVQTGKFRVTGVATATEITWKWLSESFFDPNLNADQSNFEIKQSNRRRVWQEHGHNIL